MEGYGGRFESIPPTNFNNQVVLFYLLIILTKYEKHRHMYP